MSRNNYKLELRYFSPEEFGEWFTDMDSQLLVNLDLFRHLLNLRVSISPATGSLGRRLGHTNRSQHNIDLHKCVRAADVMPHWDNSDPVALQAQRAILLATQVGFGGIGFYPDWKPRAGLHLDQRPRKKNQKPATWGAVRTASGAQKYITMKEAFA